MPDGREKAMTSQALFTPRGRNRDVLTCIANLSNDEVFTPPDFTNRMLDTDDKATNEFMQNFYSLLLKGIDSNEALYKAKKVLIADKKYKGSQ